MYTSASVYDLWLNYIFLLKGDDLEKKLPESPTTTPTLATTIPPVPQLNLHIGNTTVSACNISTQEYTKLTAFYPHYCTQEEADSDSDDTDKWVSSWAYLS